MAHELGADHHHVGRRRGGRGLRHDHPRAVVTMAYPDAHEMAFSTPEAVITERVHMSEDGDTFMRIMWAMQATPLGANLSRDDWALVRSECVQDAETRYLARLADF